MVEEFFHSLGVKSTEELTNYTPQLFTNMGSVEKEGVPLGDKSQVVSPLAALGEDMGEGTLTHCMKGRERYDMIPHQLQDEVGKWARDVVNMLN